MPIKRYCQPLCLKAVALLIRRAALQEANETLRCKALRRCSTTQRQPWRRCKFAMQSSMVKLMLMWIGMFSPIAIWACPLNEENLADVHRSCTALQA